MANDKYALITVIFIILMSIIGIVYAAGQQTTKIEVLEKKMQNLNSMPSKVASINANIINIQEDLNDIKEYILK